MTHERKQVDWQAIQLDCRRGIKSMRQVAREHGISHTAIQKRAKKEGWTRDLAERFKQQSAAATASATVTAPVARETVQVVRHPAEVAKGRPASNPNMRERQSIAEVSRVSDGMNAEVIVSSDGKVGRFHDGTIRWRVI